MRAATGIVSAVVEAWQELRVNRLRVLLSLIVVAVSVAAFTAVVALGQILNQGYQEQMERNSGRPALVQLSAFDPASGNSVDPAAFARAFDATVDRYGIEWSSRRAWLEVIAPDGQWMNLQAVDADYGVMHRVPLAHGSWLSESDALRFVPVVVINEFWWRSLGSPPLASHPTVEFGAVAWDPVTGEPTSGRATQALVVGVMPSAAFDQSMQGYVLFDDALELRGEELAASTTYETWIPPESAEPLMAAMQASVQAHLPEGVEVYASRTDFAGMQTYNPYDAVLLVFGGIAVLVLLLGALSLLNITLVTVRYRIREIGVRRSFGASAGRVFFSVMLESVVATVVAGVVGIVIAIMVMRLPVVAQVLSGLQDVPAFPMSAALAGLLISAAVGALAGLVPALVAVRVRPIDAIRY
ncbi:ABC transporter permease [Microbacterium album]|uniref:ABC transporter permease n=1 Tax=Microbacterium album TaxID=2053191 RepID=A0A917IDU5_9MICO|nr:ABC transporter permease [Microbacterium album]GGH35662.1 hypothetical protein GCM10010921_04220 [Microbacterium album]